MAPSQIEREIENLRKKALGKCSDRITSGEKRPPNGGTMPTLKKRYF